VCGVVNLFRCFQRVGRQRDASLVTLFLLLLLGSGFRLTLAVRASLFELSLRFSLHVPQRDLEVVKREVGTCCFLLGFLLALSSVGPNCG
jgi:hypothetical protein